MSLLTKEVSMKWNPKNKKWYESKGYNFTKYNDIFTVKIEDLTSGSNALVNVNCDDINCKNPYLKPMTWHDYLKCVKADDKYYCRNCKQPVNIIKGVKTKLLKSKSFEQWCIENNRKNILDRWDYELNNCKPSKVNYSSHKKYYFKCPCGLHNSELKNINNFTKGEDGVMNCKRCNSFAQYLIDLYGDNALTLYWDYEKNKGINPWNIDKNFAKPKIWIKCQEKDYHYSYNISCNSFVCGQRCGYCNHNSGKIHKFDSLGWLYPEVFKIWSDKNKNSPYEYAPMSSKYVYWKCPEGKHKDYKRRIEVSTIQNFRCPECVSERNESFLQEKVRLYFTNLKFTILNERNTNIKCFNPKTKILLPYDNEVKELKLIIEVHGMQHYRITSYTKQTGKRNNTTPEYELHYQKLKDRYKRIFAKSQGYFYLEIPYWTDNKEETWRKLIDDKINEITRLERW